MLLPLILSIFFLSGTAGLLFQIVWVREFGLIFGNTLHSASLVTGVFLGGLGLGGYVAGVVADRAYRRDRLASLRLYALAEAGIAALGLLVAWLLPRLEVLSAAVSSYRAGADGWLALSPASYVLRYAVAVLLLAPITLLMGGTLTLLIRFLVGADTTRAGWLVGLLYGLNTAGAAGACLMVDVLWIPRLGVWSAQFFAAALNLIAASGAFLILKRWRHVASGVSEPVDRTPNAARGPTYSVWSASAALILIGFAALGTEILWFRFLTSALGQYRLVFSLLLAEILIGIWIGSMAAGYLANRFGGASFWLMGAQVAFVLATLGSLWLFDLSAVQQAIRDRLGATPAVIGLPAEMRIHLGAIFQVVGLPAFFMGFAYPLANAIVQDREGAVGRRAGVLYLANSLGSVSGSAVTGFVMLPALGMKWSLCGLLACSLGAILPLALASKRERFAARHRPGAAWTLGTALVAALVVLLAWTRTPADDLTLKSFRAAGRAAVREALRPPFLVSTSEGPLESIVVLDVPGQGRTLYTNGHPMSSTAAAEQRYMRAFVHLPLLHIDAPETVLIICFGVGNTAHAASLYGSIRRLEVVDISRHVLEHAPFFAATNGGVLRDPRVAVFVNDGRNHLRMQAGAAYDLITLEPPPINFSGVASLYSREFYALARNRLRPGGFLSQWLPIPQVPAEAARSMIRAFIDVFPGALLLHGDTGNFILVGRRDLPIELDPAALDRRLAANPGARADLERTEMATPIDILAAFAAGPAGLASATAGSAPLTDDLPIIEYGRIYRPRIGLPRDLFHVAQVTDWCPGCFVEGEPIAALQDLPTYLGIMNGYYSRPRSGLDPFDLARLPASWRSALGPAEVARAIDRSPYLRRLRGDR